MKIVKKDGNVRKAYAMKVWIFATKTFCDSFNEDINDEEFANRIKLFYDMLNAIRK